MMIYWKLSIFLIIAGLVFHVAGNPTVAPTKEEEEECQRKITKCSMSTSITAPVCASDGVTYPSECQVIIKKCQGEAISIKQKGPCPETPPCFSARVIARPGTLDCRQDGTYAPVQCHTETGYCWCVTPQGRPLADTSVLHKRPRCDDIELLFLSKMDSNKESKSKKAEKKNRDSISYQNQPRHLPNKQQKRRSTGCNHSEKSNFNKNLIENFKIEYRRTNISVDGDQNNERVLSWKFSTLDKDGDGQLDRDEYKELRRLAKKVVKPKKCARTFLKTCDSDQDSYLSRHEWGACLLNDFTLRLFLSLNGADGRRQVTEAQKIRATDQVLKETPTRGRPGLIDVSPEPKDENDANDCISDRKSVLEDQRESSKEKKKQEKVYVPECTSDGRYQKVQCYSGYCWCVYQDTGKPIPGTSSKDGTTPNCNPVPSPNRPMKGCPENMKQLFLRDLLNLIEKKMEDSNTDSDEVTKRWSTSREERIATWHFNMLNKNNNTVLERKEWKNFRTLVINEKKLRRCGKKLPRYCDINNDRTISKTEWLNCLNAHRPPLVDSEEKTSTLKPRRKGPNPLEFILKDN